MVRGSVGLGYEIISGTLGNGRLAFIEPFPHALVPGFVPVNELFSLEVVLGNIEISPPREEILVKRGIQATGGLVMLEDKFGQTVDIQTRMIVFYPDIVAENNQLQKGAILVELELDVFLDGLQPLEKFDAFFICSLKFSGVTFGSRILLARDLAPTPCGFRSIIFASRQFCRTLCKSPFGSTKVR